MRFRKGDRVTNDLGWDGRVTRVETGQTTPDGFYFWVHWQEREHHHEKVLQRKPICGHLTTQLRKFQ